MECHSRLVGKNDGAAPVGHLHAAGKDDPAVILDPHRLVGVHATFAKICVDDFRQHDQAGIAAGDHHVAYQVDNIYETCRELMDKGLSLNLPPRDGFMAFVKSPDGISFELLQKGGPLPVEEPWASMPDQGTW